MFGRGRKEQGGGQKTEQRAPRIIGHEYGVWEVPGFIPKGDVVVPDAEETALFEGMTEDQKFDFYEGVVKRAREVNDELQDEIQGSE